MASLSIDTLRGYVLEELLASLIRNTGYRLLVDASQDPDELENLPNGLGVRGRGGAHQVDVLGELAWIPAFTFPLRLVVEAKARADRTGIGEVRNAVGVVSDVNQNYVRSATGHGALLRRFSYRYALFSTSGFSAPAAEYALAHQISLVDLSGAGFADIVDLARAVTAAIWGNDPPDRGGGFVGRLRRHLRTELGTWPDDAPSPAVNADPEDLDGRWSRSREVLQRRHALGELFVGMAAGPYLLILRAADPQRVINLLEREPIQDVWIHWSPDVEEGTEWSISLSDTEGGLEMTFALPDAVASWIFDDEAKSRRRALQFKERFLSSITIYRYVGGRDRLYRLQFRPEQVAQSRRERRVR